MVSVARLTKKLSITWRRLVIDAISTVYQTVWVNNEEHLGELRPPPHSYIAGNSNSQKDAGRGHIAKHL